MEDKELLSRIQRAGVRNKQDSEKILAFMKFEEINNNDDEIDYWIEEVIDGWKDERPDEYTPAKYMNFRSDNFLILTEDEANYYTENKAEKSIHSRSARFLSNYIPFLDKEVIEIIQKSQYANKAVRSLLNVEDNLQNAIFYSIEEEGRAYYLCWNHEKEYIEEVGRNTYYIYQQD